LVYRDPDGQLVKRNLSPTDAAREAQRVFSGLVFRDLSGPQTLEAAVLASARDGIRGSNFHDFLHARTAEAFGATSIVTLNMVDFRKMTSLPLEHPVQP
jgi:predicted nucleic acid-binding protein